MAKRGRKEKYDAAKIYELVERMAGVNLNLTQISYVLGLKPESFSRYKRKHPELDQAYTEGREKLKYRLKSKAVQMGLAGNPEMLKFTLKNLAAWKDQPLIDASQHNHVTYVWNDQNANDEKDSDPVQPAALPERNPLLEIPVQNGSHRPAGWQNGNGHKRDHQESD